MPTTRYKAYPRHVRAHVLRVAKEAGDWKTVADIYDVKERTAWGWIKAAMDTGDWSGNQKQRGGSPKKILDAHVDYLRDELSKTPELTLAQMAELVEQKFDVTVSRETVRRALDARSFTVKKLHRDVINRNNPINKQKRSDYVIKFYAALANNKRVFYLDETNFNLWCSRGRGWSARGRRAIQNGVASKGKNIHVIAVISSTSLAYQESQFGSFTAESRTSLSGTSCATSGLPPRWTRSWWCSTTRHAILAPRTFSRRRNSMTLRC
ncbi:hypothetical protein PC116_g21759 [Phytophthora cactorum]|nr:hypothetical protein Pcac1_g646 [Phytophthora cactorum]KAG4229931.1 hypothetical protein PC116_g21759 [Phytophthora cactorum]